MAGRVEEVKRIGWRTRDNSTGSAKVDGDPVIVPRGEGKAARRYAAEHGAQVVGMEFAGGRTVYFDRKGRRLRGPDPLVAHVLKPGRR